jgi:hypothetical protein
MILDTLSPLKPPRPLGFHPCSHGDLLFARPLPRLIKGPDTVLSTPITATTQRTAKLINLVQLHLARLLCYNQTPSLPDASVNSSAKPRQPKQKAKLICISRARCLSIHPDDDRTIEVGELPYHCPPLPPSPAVMGSSEPSRRPRVSSYFFPFPSCVPLSSLCRGISNHFLPNPNPNPSPFQNKYKEYAAPLTAAPGPSFP